jgi:methylglutaconyl-CoA hydratase
VPDYQKLLYTVEQSIAHITLNRPDKRNALDGEIIAELKDALKLAARDESVHVVLLTGAGSDFCSGADLAALRQVSEATVLENISDARNLGELFIMMRRHPRPIVAAVRGRALAGGCGLAAASDIILAAESAQFGYPEINIGFVPAMVMAMLRRSVSEKRAFELIAGGEVISARAALGIGLINRVFADEKFDDEVKSYLTRLARQSPSAMSLTKNLFYHMDGLTFEAAIESGAHLNAIARMTEDCKRGIERFLSKQLP